MSRSTRSGVIGTATGLACAGLGLLGLVGFVDDFIAALTDAETADRHPEPFEGRDLTPDEAVAGARILIDEVSDGHNVIIDMIGAGVARIL